MPRPRLGRPTTGPAIVQTIDAGSEEGRRRAQAILKTLAGQTTIGAAIGELGISQPRFFQIRTQALTALVEAASPRPAHRPARRISPEQARIAELEAKVEGLEQELARQTALLGVAEIRREVDSLSDEAKAQGRPQKESRPRHRRTRTRTRTRTRPATQAKRSS